MGERGGDEEGRWERGMEERGGREGWDERGEMRERGGWWNERDGRER